MTVLKSLGYLFMFLTTTAISNLGAPKVWAQVVGVDLSGNYVFLRSQCFDRVSGESSALFTLTNYSETLQISGNTFVRNISGGNCTAVNTGSVTFNADGTFSAPESPISVPAGNCSFVTDFSIAVGDEIRESGAVTIEFQNGGTFPAQEGEFRRMDDLLLLQLSDVSFVPNDICFDVYQIAER